MKHFLILVIGLLISIIATAESLGQFEEDITGFPQGVWFYKEKAGWKNETGYKKEYLNSLLYKAEEIANYPGNRYTIYRSKNSSIIFVADNETRTFYLLNNKDALWSDIQIGYWAENKNSCHYVFVDTQYLAQSNELDEFFRTGVLDTHGVGESDRKVKEIRQKHKTHVLLRLPAQCVNDAILSRMNKSERRDLMKAQEDFKQYLARMEL
ncbi:TPA: hypothetical protein J8W05_004166 [Escherichia coli]|nr:hypothetical protein [Escherichia coli]